MPELNSSVSLTTTLPQTTGFTLDTIVTSGATAELSQDAKFSLKTTSAEVYDQNNHGNYITTYGLQLTNLATKGTVTLASGSSSSYQYTSLSNFTVGDDTFYIASYLKGGSQLAYRVFDDAGAAVIAETVVDTGTRIDSIYYDGAGALVLAYSNSTEFAALTFSHPDAPVAVTDTATMKQDDELKVAVVANDTDPNGDKLSLVSATVVSGSAEVSVVKGKVVVDYTGADLWLDETSEITIHYVVSDGTFSSTGVLTVDVTDGYNRMGGSKESFSGTDGRDYIEAAGVNGGISAYEGDDIIIAGPKTKIIEGMGGDDIIISGADGTHLRGGAGNDILVAFGARALFRGDGGNDVIIDGPKQTSGYGGAGNDTFYDNGGGSDLYLGEAGADIFYFFLGAGAKNKIVGFDNNDLLRIDADAAVGMQVDRHKSQPVITFTLADGSEIVVVFDDIKDAKGSAWYEIGDYSIPTDPHGLY